MFWSIVIFLDFLKVLCFSFPVPVVGPSAKLALSLVFSAENIQNLPLALRARKKNRDQLVGKSIISPTSHLAGNEVECLAHAWDLHCNSCNHDLSIPNLVQPRPRFVDTEFQSLSDRWLAWFLGSPELSPLVGLVNRHLVASCQMGFLNILCFGYIYFFVRDVLGKEPKSVL